MNTNIGPLLDRALCPSIRQPIRPSIRAAALFLALLPLVTGGLGARSAAAAQPGGAAEPSDTLVVTSWLVAGPFPSGTREALVDPIYPASPATLAPSEGDSIASWLAPGGWARWTRVTGEGPTVTMELPGVDWEGASGQWGVGGIVSSALAFGELQVPSSGRYWIDAKRVGSLYVDGRRYLGNPYGIGAFRAPIGLAAGRHTVLLRVGGTGPREASFRLIRNEHPAGLLADDLTLPDLVIGETIDSWGAIPVVNLSGSELRGAVLRFGGGAGIQETEVVVPVLPPEGMLKVPFRVRATEPAREGERAPMVVRLALGDREIFAACSLRVRAPHESRRITFLSSIDGSVQKYALLPPSVDGPGPFTLLFSLHGASVEPEPQVDSYAPKDWAYVVAPTNTRPYGFDWQDWGRKNAIETLDLVLAHFPIDPDRVLLVGHSMGGHGVWHVGLSDPGRFAAFAPSAGWGSFNTYSTFTLREDVLAGDPRSRVLWERAIAPDNPLAFLDNARGMPVFVLHGQADDNVPVFHGRMLAHRAREAGARVVYREVPEQGHWWDLSPEPGVDCVDLAEMMEFLRGQRRGAPPDTIVLATADLETCDRSRWLRIVEAERPFSRVEVRAHRTREDGERKRDGFALETRGARAIAIDPSGIVPPGKLGIAIDGDRVEADWREGEILLERRAKGWAVSRGSQGSRRRASIKEPFFSPFLLVHGTAGSPEETAAARRLAVLDAQAWLMRGNGYAEVVADRDVTTDQIGSRNLILYGTPGSNELLERVAVGLPIQVGRDGVSVAGRRYPAPAGAPLAVRFAHASPLAPGRWIEVIAGTDLEGLELAAVSNPCYSGSGYPDFVVYGKESRRTGWGGMRAAGFFEPDGTIDAASGNVTLR